LFDQLVQQDIHSVDDIEFFVIDSFMSIDEAKQFEMMWVDELHSLCPRGLNVQYDSAAVTSPDKPHFDRLRYVKTLFFFNVIRVIKEDRKTIQERFWMSDDEYNRAVKYVEHEEHKKTILSTKPSFTSVVEYYKYILDLLRPIELPIPKNLQPRVKYVLIDGGITLISTADGHIRRVMYV
jgi:hypothetical protein